MNELVNTYRVVIERKNDLGPLDCGLIILRGGDIETDRHGEAEALAFAELQNLPDLGMFRIRDKGVLREDFGYLRVEHVSMGYEDVPTDAPQ